MAPRSTPPSPSCARGIVRAVATLALAAAVTVAPAASAAAASGDGAARWVRPVDGPVVVPFTAPTHAFGAGHRGADLASPPGSPVRAAGAGTIAFAGSVAGSLHVVVLHGGGLRTSVSFLAAVAVRRGDTVEAGDVLGASGGIGPHHEPGVVHVALRAGERYLDPMPLFDAIDLPSVVHLAPLGGDTGPASVARERRGLLDTIGGAVTGATGALADGVRWLARTGSDAAAGAARAVRSAGVAVLDGTTAGALRALASAATAWLRERRECDPGAPGADGTGGSGHDVMVVAGINSRGGGRRPTVGVPMAALDYGPEEVRWFSYSDAPAGYGPADTHVPIEVAAERLADQLRAMQRARPGRQVDLVAHSQGGLVVLAFLALVYDPGDPSYPPLGDAVLLSAPLEGAPLASATREIASSRTGDALLDAARLSTGGAVPDPASRAVRDLAEDSALVRRLRGTSLPWFVRVLSVGGAGDPIVPASSTGHPDVERVTVRVLSLGAHTDVVDDPAALRAARAHLERRPLPCTPFLTHLAGATVPPVLSGVERTAGRVLGAASRAADAVVP